MSRKQSLQKAFLGMMGLTVVTLLALLGGTDGWAQKPAPYKFPTTIYWATGDVGSLTYACDALVSEKIAPALLRK